ncbi:hypothetical protein [uncultured Sphingomonas sp.]|uniref:hypothetical protein n=1 Tax=uncultured Sphingomonas sp. TaxID=158754 RepID=UPI0025EA842B|nr:hypothetical protein [uncultured Sphingomonas sp.]
MQPRTRLDRLWQSAASLALLLAPATLSPSHAADTAPFDLPGPGMRITVTRGARTLPIGEVPGLATGDLLHMGADLPDDQRARFLLVSAFLQGATNPPAKSWIRVAETWKRKDKDRLLAVTVPKGARQLVLFLVPDTGGASDTIIDNVRGRPGEFVRATQDLNQASLDRSRLDAFMAAIQAQENSYPEYLKTVAPVLARSLSMKLNEDCLAKVIELQAACLLENRESLVLGDVHGSSLAETLTGATTDLALQLSATPEAGFGYYTPYIGVVRDIARVFGAFSNPQFNYLPTLSLRQGAGVSLLLNAAPSFKTPKSVLVAAMPAIDASSPPRLRNTAEQPICAMRPGIVLPVDGAPLIYSTAYAHTMAVRLTTADGRTMELPVQARADRGGYVPKQALPTWLSGTIKAHLHGAWGFDPFDGPDFTLQAPDNKGWSSQAATTLVTGRDNVVTLTGAAPACVHGVTMRRGASAEPVAWTMRGDGAIDVTLPLKAAKPGELTLEVRQFGATGPSTLTLRAYEQASRLDRLDIHAGDRWGILSGQRLDQVAAVEFGDMRLKPDGLSRDGEVDRLRIAAEGMGSGAAASSGTARILLTQGRTASLPVTIAPPRPNASLLNMSVTPKQAPAAILLEVQGKDVLPDTARLVFSMKAAPGTQLLPSDGIEIATGDGLATTRLAAGPDLRLQGPEIMVGSFDPASLGPSAFGPLRFRIVRGAETGDWQPLVTLARLPRLEALDCPADAADAGCNLRGQGLFLIAAVAPTPALERSIAVPAGFTGATLGVPKPEDGRLYLRLRDAPDAVAVASVARPRS